MSETQQNNQNEFIIEKIKERPVNKKKLVRRTIITAAMAVIFGLIACFTFLILEPVINNWLYPEEEPQIVVFPEDQEEMSPEEMLSDNMQAEIKQEEVQENIALEEERIQHMLDSIVLDKDDYRQMYTALSNYAAELNKYMVTVTGVSSDIDWLQNVMENKNQCSGLIIANNGRELLVLVDYEPVREAEKLTLTFHNNVQAEARLKQYDPVTKLAVLAVSLAGLDREFRDSVELASLGSSNVKSIVGTPVIALGSPTGSSGSMCYGMITSANLQQSAVDASYKLLTTDIYGSPEAGGVLFNLQGEVVGIITRNSPDSEAHIENMITAYGISDLRSILEKMSNGSPVAYLGIKGVDVTKEASEKYQVPYGAYVKEVAMDSPAMLAGIQQGDVIVGIEDTVILRFADYYKTLMGLEAGQTVQVRVMRLVQEEYKEMSFEITLAETP